MERQMNQAGPKVTLGAFVAECLIGGSFIGIGEKFAASGRMTEAITELAIGLGGTAMAIYDWKYLHHSSH